MQQVAQLLLGCSQSSRQQTPNLASYLRWLDNLTTPASAVPEIWLVHTKI